MGERVKEMNNYCKLNCCAAGDPGMMMDTVKGFFDNVIKGDISEEVIFKLSFEG